MFTFADFQCSAKAGTGFVGNNDNNTATVVDTDTDIQNCFYQNSYTNQCEICAKGYELDEKKLVCSRIIPNCKDYKSAYECEKCEKNYIKSMSLV